MALRPLGEVSTLADQAHGPDVQDWLDHPALASGALCNPAPEWRRKNR